MRNKQTNPKISTMRRKSMEMNLLKKAKTSDFLCDFRFRNELPDPSAKGKLLPLNRDPDRYCKYQISSLEKNWKPRLYVEPDVGIPLDLLDLCVFNPPKGERIPLDPEDEELLRDDDPTMPIKTNGIKTEERPSDKGVSSPVKTQYISPLSTDSTNESLTEKKAKKLREYRSRDILENLDRRERKNQDIMASFEAAKHPPVHKVDRQLKPIKVLPLFPDFDRYDKQFVVANFDTDPVADSEIFSKLNAAYCHEHEHRLEKDMYDENGDISYSWVQKYHCDDRSDAVDDPKTYLVTFGESDAKYLPLPTKLVLRKERARDGKSSEEVENFPVHETVTVRRRSTVAAVDSKDEGDLVASKGSTVTSTNGRVGGDGCAG